MLGLGSNLGDSKLIICRAIRELEEVLKGLRAASLYETEPLGVKDQGRFINTAVAGFYPSDENASSAAELLKAIHLLEAKYGRDRSRERRWGERFLDIDILLFGNLAVNEPNLVIPHPRLKERRFALQPLLELLPRSREPGTGLSYRGVCDALPDQGVIKISGGNSYYEDYCLGVKKRVNYSE